MILLDENQEAELLKNPKKLMQKYKTLINRIGVMVDEVNNQIDITENDEKYCLNEYIRHRDIISQLRIVIRKELDMFSDYLDILDERRGFDGELDEDNIYKKQVRLIERLIQQDSAMLKKLVNGEKEHNRAINQIQKRYKNLEVDNNATSKKISSKSCGAK